MFATARFFACLALALASSAGQAQTINASTTCEQARAVLDAQNPDMQRVKAIFAAVDQSLEAFDRLYDSYGKGKILPRMSPDGRKNTAAAVTKRHHPKQRYGSLFGSQSDVCLNGHSRPII